jgi:hypothetical protein
MVFGFKVKYNDCKSTRTVVIDWDWGITMNALIEQAYATIDGE